VTITGVVGEVAVIVAVLAIHASLGALEFNRLGKSDWR
jgi:hypothetical protein